MIYADTGYGTFICCDTSAGRDMEIYLLTSVTEHAILVCTLSMLKHVLVAIVVDLH